MLGGLSSQRPTLRRDARMHPPGLQFDLGDRLGHLGHLGDLLPERPTLRPQLLDTQERIRPVQARIGHHGKAVPSNRDGYPQPRILP